MKISFLTTAAILILSINISFSGDITGKVTHGSKKCSNAVVYIGGQNSSTSGKHAKMNQKNLTFSPHVLPIEAGTTVDFLNSDDVLHNVYTTDACADNFNLGSYPKGEKASFTFTIAGCVATILCNVHPEMEAYIVTLGTPYFALSTSGGTYKIKNVPAGTYTLKVWHEKYQGSDVSVDVPESGEVTVDIDL
jgi:plastocyanin